MFLWLAYKRYIRISWQRCCCSDDLSWMTILLLQCPNDEPRKTSQPKPLLIKPSAYSSRGAFASRWRRCSSRLRAPRRRPGCRSSPGSGSVTGTVCPAILAHDQIELGAAPGAVEFAEAAGQSLGRHGFLLSRGLKPTQERPLCRLRCPASQAEGRRITRSRPALRRLVHDYDEVLQSGRLPSGSVDAWNRISGRFALEYAIEALLR